MGVPRSQLPSWDNLQLLVAQLDWKPLMEDVAVATELIIGPEAAKPLRPAIPLFVSDMSFGALSEEAKTVMASGAELAGTGICSGEGGMLPEEQAANSRYFYELASARFCYDEKLLRLMFRDHISVPTIPLALALARARRYLDQQGASGRVTLIITCGLRTHMDFVKTMALGTDGVALANRAMKAIGCVGARMCNSNNCQARMATQKPELRARLDVKEGAQRLNRFLASSVELMQVMARACGHAQLSEFSSEDLGPWHEDTARPSGVNHVGM